ncbi:MAG: PQQ-dependent sugar dehydrogenase [Polyangiaceae bacterium]
MRHLTLTLLVLAACGGEPVTEPPPAAVGSLPPRPDTASCQLVGQPPEVVQEVVAGASPLSIPADVVSGAVVDGALWLLTNDGRLLDAHLTSGLDVTGDTDVALGLASSPSHPGQIFVLRRRLSGALRLSRFSLAASPATGFDPASEALVLESYLALGGAVAFAPDGRLFVALDDDGRLPEESTKAGDPTSIEGALLRLDVSDLSQGPAIPADNPTLSDLGGMGSEPTRIWATGLRRPVALTLDDSGIPWLVDQGVAVGEVHRVTRAQDLGWPTFDGTGCNLPAGCELQLERFPQSTLEGDDACPLVGAVLPSSTTFASLHGTLFFAQSCSGRVFGMKTNAPDGWLRRETVLEREGPVVSLIASVDGDLLLVEPSGAARVEAAHEGVPFPRRLSESGCFDADFAPRPGVIPFEVNAPLWSDGSLKDRYFEIPTDAAISIDDEGNLELPVGAVVIKHFGYAVEGANKPVETRMLIRRSHGWEAHSYRWNDAGTDADLLDDGDAWTLDVDQPNGAAVAVEHTLPSRHTCVVCHGLDTARPLALRSDQLDRSRVYGEGMVNQLEAMEAIGLFASAPPSRPPMAEPGDPSASADDRARAYLHTNCGHCHRPGGWVSATVDMDLRFDTPFADTQTCNVTAKSGELGLRLVPGDAEASRIYQRMSRRDPFQMPPFATTLVDDRGVQVVGAFIAGLSDCP